MKKWWERLQELLSELKITGETPEVRSDKRFNLIDIDEIVDIFDTVDIVSSDRSSCSRPLTTFSHNLLTLLKISLYPPHAPQKFGAFIPVYSCQVNYKC